MNFVARRHQATQTVRSKADVCVWQISENWMFCAIPALLKQLHNEKLCCSYGTTSLATDIDQILCLCDSSRREHTYIASTTSPSGIGTVASICLAPTRTNVRIDSGQLFCVDPLVASTTLNQLVAWFKLQ